MLRLCSSLGLLFAMLFIFPLPFRASDCLHNFLPIFIVCLVVYFAVHNLCLGSSTPRSPPLSFSAPAAACLCCADSRILPLPVGSPAPPTLFCHLSGVAIFCASCAWVLSPHWDPGPELEFWLLLCWSPARVRVPGGNVLRSKCS